MVWGLGFWGFRVQQLRIGSSSFIVELHSRFRHNTHPPRESHNIGHINSSSIHTNESRSQLRFFQHLNKVLFKPWGLTRWSPKP